MIDKWQAIQNFWSGFEWPAYDENSVPEDASYPRITYEVQTDSLDNVILLSASLWDRSTSWEKVSKKADQIASEIVHMDPPTIRIAGGGLYISKGSPFASRMADEDDSIRRIYLNINAEFLTAN
jgi:hypothetical protein